MSQIRDRKTGQEYWRSLEELARTTAFKQFYEREFPVGGSEANEATRRKFLKIMGASLALAGLSLSGCRMPEDHIAPYAHLPEGRTPGIPVQYATAMDVAGSALGLLVTSYDGRPIKAEGNPTHPISHGATNVFAQASVLEIYDPDRCKNVIDRTGGRDRAKTWDEFAAFASGHFSELKSKNGKGLYVLSEAVASPSVDGRRKELLSAYPEAKWYEYEPVSRDNEIEGARLSFGTPHRTHYAFGRARAIVSFDADFMYEHPAAVRYARDFVQGRNADSGSMSRLYVIESAHSLTGSNADHRIVVEQQVVLLSVLVFAAELFHRRGIPVPAGYESLGEMLRPFLDHPAKPEGLTLAASDIAAYRGAGIVLCGAWLPPEIHALVNLINMALGNQGKTLAYTLEIDAARPTHVEAIKSLTDAMDAGQVETLLVLGGNPVYNAPADLDFAGKMRKAGTILRLSLFDDETSALSTWQLPRAHFLESWSVVRAYEGTATIAQPLIEPLYGGKTIEEFLGIILGSPKNTGYEIVRDAFDKLTSYGDLFEMAWRAALVNGIVFGTRYIDETPYALTASFLEKLASLAQGAKAGEGIAIRFVPDYSVYDGRYANSGWLQELPDPMCKITWDNVALMSPALGKKLGVSTGDVVKISSAGRDVSIPAYIMPGQAENTITLPLGYGRKRAGKVGNRVGVDVYPLRTTGAMYVLTGATVVKTGKRVRLASTQDHHAMDVEALGRRETEKRLGSIVRQTTLSHYKDHKDFAKGTKDEKESTQLFAGHPYEGHKWGMVIDLNSCIGCGVCTIACQAENNIPIVGKTQVAKGREMHWIRVDRYFKGDPASPSVAHQPMTCHQCENAPCEQVCPVGATSHSAEGLNQMVYNRCIGTRYCSNNCPYKVRRFNFFNYRKDLPETERLQLNPDVTVRGRGVMEKCTFCIQRIEAVKIDAKNNNRDIRDGQIIPACAQACPTQAIIFGDLNDGKSLVSKLAKMERSYGVLAELNVRPRVSFLAKITNPNPSMDNSVNETGEATNPGTAAEK